MTSRFDGPAGYRSASWAGKGTEVDEKTGERIDGICISCHQWDAELKDGYCRDEACKAQRRAAAIADGRAIKLIDGLPGGVKVLHSKAGKQYIKE